MMFFFPVQPSFRVTAWIVVIAKKDSSAIIACVQTTLPSPPLPSLLASLKPNAFYDG